MSETDDNIKMLRKAELMREHLDSCHSAPGQREVGGFQPKIEFNNPKPLLPVESKPGFFDSFFVPISDKLGEEGVKRYNDLVGLSRRIREISKTASDNLDKDMIKALSGLVED